MQASIRDRLAAAGWQIKGAKDGGWLSARHPNRSDVELEPYSSGDEHGVAIRRPDESLQLRGKAVDRLSAEVAALFGLSGVVPPGIPVLRASILSAANARSGSPVHRNYFRIDGTRY